MLVVPFNLTLFCLLIKCDFIRPSGSSETPNALSLFISSAERKESKGLLISGDNNPGLSTLSDNLEESKFWTVSAGLKITLWDFPINRRNLSLLVRIDFHNNKISNTLCSLSYFNTDNKIRTFHKLVASDGL